MSINCRKIQGAAREWIQKIINTPPTHARIQQQVQMVWGVEIRKRGFKKLIKQDLRISYKRGSTGSSKIVQLSSTDANALFWARILSEIYGGKLMVNVDE